MEEVTPLSMQLDALAYRVSVAQSEVQQNGHLNWETYARLVAYVRSIGLRAPMKERSQSRLLDVFGYPDGFLGDVPDKSWWEKIVDQVDKGQKQQGENARNQARAASADGVGTRDRGSGAKENGGGESGGGGNHALGDRGPEAHREP